MDQGKEPEQEDTQSLGIESNALSAPGIENCRSSDKSTNSSSDLGNEENKIAKVFDTLAAGSKQVQNIQITGDSSQLGIEKNLEVTPVTSISAETQSKSSSESQKAFFKISGSHLLDNINSTENDKGNEKKFISSFLENVSCVDLNVNTGEERQNELQKSSPFLIQWKVSGKPVPKPRHLPYSAKLSRHVRHRTSSSVNQTSVDCVSAHTSMNHVSAHMVAQADSITNKKFDTAEVTELLVCGSKQMSKGEGAKLDLNPSDGHMRKCNPKNLEITTDILVDGKSTYQGRELMNMSLHIEVDIDCPLVNNDSIKISPVTETSFCFENLSLIVPDEDADLIREDVALSEIAGGSDLIKLPGNCEQSYSVCVNSLMKVQPQSGSSVNVASTILSQNGSAANLSKDNRHTSNIPYAMENMLHSSAVNSSEIIQQQKGSDIITSETSNMQHQNCSAGDIITDMPQSISSSMTNDFVKNIQRCAADSSKNAKQNSKAANGSKETQKEINSAMNPSIAEQSNNVTDASKNKGQRVSSAETASKIMQQQNSTAINQSLSAQQSKNTMDDSKNKAQKFTTTAASKNMQQRNSNAINLSSSAQQSNSAVGASKNKEQKVCNATTTASKHIQQQNSCVTNSFKNVQQNGNSAATNKIKVNSSVSSFDAQQQNGNAVCSENVQQQKDIKADLPKGMQQENTCTKLSQTVHKQKGPVFKDPNFLRPSAHGEHLSSCAEVPSGKIGLSQNQKCSNKTKKNKNSALSLLSDTNICYQPLQDCRDLIELASCKTTDYRVQREKRKHILEEPSRANTFQRFKHFQFSRATENDVLELYGRLPVILPEDLEETPMCEEDITDFTSKKDKVRDLERLLQNQGK